VHTSNLPALFAQLQISLVVSTYQAGKVILVRNDGSALNTHFRTFAKPMGIAADQQRLTIGGANMVWDYRNMPAVAQKLEPVGKHDACYLPRRIHVTGDIDIHEMAYDRDNELWVVNTRFCCLCTLDAAHSFHPRWRPPFVSALAPKDRCLLNGLGEAYNSLGYLLSRQRQPQKAIAYYERAIELQPPLDLHVQDLDSHLQDYGDTALIIDQLDLVITVDTSVAHLAGALGKPVWTLLPYVPDWRWGLEGKTTPWYPTMRLFRQTRPGEWAEVLGRVAQALAVWRR
jgi:tetratricopeptide (TPR) repeat protein